MPNARFWDYCNGGWVKLTLNPGQNLVWRKYEDTEEGYSFIQQSWEHYDNHVFYYEYSKARDCDGLMEYHTTQRAKFDELKANFTYYNDRAEPGFMTPKWEKVDSSQRDHSAEAMGY